jgi:uncharacterized protein (DUF58 family)
VRLALALALMMVLSASLSLALLVRSRAAFTKASASPGRVTTFKGTRAALRIDLGSALAGWVTVSAVPAADGNGFETRVLSSNGRRLEMELTPRYAGRFEKLRFLLELSDVLGLFVDTNLPLEVDLVVDSLPTSLLAYPQKPRTSPLALGERSSGAPGSGQEFYGIDEYQPFMEAKNILWKRAGRRADDKLVVKIRESNIPRQVRIAVVGAQEGRRLAYIDGACEALGELGSSLLEAGSMVAFVGFREGGPVVFPAAKPEELPLALMAASSLPGSPLDASYLQGADILVVDSGSLDDLQVQASIPGRALLVISDRDLPDISGRRVFVYTGHEGLIRLAEQVVNR